jgi:uncharacterized protein
MDKTFKYAVRFLILTLIVTWALYIPIPLLGWNPYSFPGFILLFFGGSAPSWIAVILVFTTYNKEQRRDYFQRLYQLKRIKPVWWLALLLLFPGVVAAGIGLSLAFGGALPGMDNLKAVIANPLVWFPLVGLSFMSGPFSEELGWRGFALDPLLRRFGFTRGNILLGLIWGVWHLPLYFMPQTWQGQMGFTLSGFWTFLVFSVGLSIIMSWVYVNTNRSILTAMLLHLSSNFSAQLIAQSDNTFELVRGLLVAIIGMGIAVYMIRAKKDAAEYYKLPAEAKAVADGAAVSV